jgi:hypothetical protein
MNRSQKIHNCQTLNCQGGLLRLCAGAGHGDRRKGTSLNQKNFRAASCNLAAILSFESSPCIRAYSSS